MALRHAHHLVCQIGRERRLRYCGAGWLGFDGGRDYGRDGCGWALSCNGWWPVVVPGNVYEGVGLVVRYTGLVDVLRWRRLVGK